MKKVTALSYFVNEHCGGIPELILQNLWTPRLTTQYKDQGTLTL